MACSSGTELPEIPDNLAPLAANTAPAPAEGEEGFLTVSGEEFDYDWVHDQGFIHAPVDAVWEAFQDLEVVVDRAAVSEYSMVPYDDSRFDVSFQVRNLVEDILTVEYVREWRQSLLHSSDEGAELVAIRFEKTEGAEVIEMMVGSVILTGTDEGHTHLDIVEHLSAMQRGAEPIVAYVEDLYEDARAFSHGEPLPERSPAVE